MAVVGWRRVLDGTGMSGKVGEPLRFDEAWLIRVDSPLTPKQTVVKAVPCGWYSAHWENADCKAMEFKLSPRNADGMVWRLDVAFYPPPKESKLKSTGIPEDFWERAGGTSTVPVFRDRDGVMILNAAGDPLEGLQKEREEKSWTLTKFYTSDSWMGDVDLYAGATNSDTWDGGAPDTWKCSCRGAKRREIQNVSRGRAASNAMEGTGSESGGTDETLVFVETVWEFRYEPGTWKSMPWDVGFHELVGGQKKVILGDDQKPVKQPVALNANGTKKSPGAAPSVIRNGAGAPLYPVVTFSAKFGTPFIIPATSP
jgi:hypothetical protein